MTSSHTRVSLNEEAEIYRLAQSIVSARPKGMYSAQMVAMEITDAITDHLRQWPSNPVTDEQNHEVTSCKAP